MDEPLKRARELRKGQTETERRMWSKLRARRFASFKFRRQVPIGKYIADFVCFDKRLIKELDGGQHTTRSEYDARRTAWFEAHGFHVVRFWNHEVWEEAEPVEELIWAKLHETTSLADGYAKKRRRQNGR